MKTLLRYFLPLFLSTGMLVCHGAILQVGRSYRNVREAYAIAKDGDVIEIQPFEFSECVGEFHPAKRVQFVPARGQVRITGTDCDLPNDSFSNPTQIQGARVEANGENFRASSEGCEDLILNRGRKHSIWWSWTAPADGLAQIESLVFGTDEGRLMAVFVGTSLCELTTVAAAEIDPLETGQPLNTLFFDARANTEYHIAFDTRNSQGTFVNFELTLEPHPANDEISKATSLTRLWSNAEGSNLAATGNPNDPNPFGTEAAHKTVWWTWTAPFSAVPGRPVVISTAGSKFDTMLAVYQLTPNGLRHIESNDDHRIEECDGLNSSTSRTSQVTFVAQGGSTYMVMVDGCITPKGSDPEPKLLKQYAGDVHLTLDYSTLNITSICHRSVARCDLPDPDSRLSGSLRLTHFGDQQTRALRISFHVTNGFTMNGSFVPKGTNSTSPKSFVIPPGSLTPGNSLSIDYFDVAYPCPDEEVRQTGGNDSAKGWAVFALLEEQFGSGWVPVDSALILYGPWPNVPPFGGPNGGVIRSDPTSPAPNTLTDIVISGPDCICDNSTVLISGQAVFDLGITNAQPDWIPIGPITVSTNGFETNALTRVDSLSEDQTATISASLDFAGVKILSTVDHKIKLLSNCDKIHNIAVETNVISFEYADLTSKVVAIEYATNLSSSTLWIPVETITMPESRRLKLTIPMPTNTPLGVFRARILP